MQIVVVEPAVVDTALSPVIASAVWLAGVNLACYAAFAVDKAAARRQGRRVAERTLLWLAVLGGSPAALLAQRVLRHKTRKEPFRTQLFAIVALQVAAGVVLAVPALREPALRALGL